MKRAIITVCIVGHVISFYGFCTHWRGFLHSFGFGVVVASVVLAVVSYKLQNRKFP